MINLYKFLPEKKLSKINIAKISLLVFLSLYLFGNFEPFHEGRDELLYAISGIELSNGSYQLGNVLLENSGKAEFVPSFWVHTNQNMYIPKANPGFPILSSLAYQIGNVYALFYLGPIFTIALLIGSERVATRLFDDKIGFVTLLLLSTNFMIFSIGTRLLTDNIFALLIILGCFYFLKFLKHNSNQTLILSSLFFISASLIRIVGIVFLPLEILFFTSFFVLCYISDNREGKLQKYKILKKILRFISRKKIILYFFLLIIHWVGFIVTLSGYNYYYFGDPFTTYANIISFPTSISEFTERTSLINDSPIPLSIIASQLQEKNVDRIDVSSYRILLIEDRLEVAKGYFLYLLPSQFPWVQTLLESYEDDYGKDFLGILSILLILPILILSFKIKSHRTEILFLIFATLSIVTIYSISSIPGTVVGRYMIPTIPFFSILFGYLIVKIFKFIPNALESKPILSRSILGGFLIFLIIYFSFTFFISDPIQWGITENFKFKNPNDHIRVYPLDREGISENSILVNYYSTRALEYDMIPFDGYIGNYYLTHSPQGYSNGSVKLLENAISLGYNAYVLKNPIYIYEKEYHTFLLNQSLVLKDFSKSFCKIEIGINSTIGISPEPDEICYNEVVIPVESRWYDDFDFINQLKKPDDDQ